MCHLWQLASCKIQSQGSSWVHTSWVFFTLSHTLPLHESHLNTRYLITKLQTNLARNKANTWLNKFNLTKWNTWIIVKYLPILEVNLTINWCAIMLLLCTIGVLYFLMVWRAYILIYFFSNLVVTIIGERNLNFLGVFLQNTKKCQWSYKHYCDIFKCSRTNCSLSKKRTTHYAKTNN